jgi:putative ATPase
MEAAQFYQPVPRGLEIRIGEKLDELRRLNEAALAANPPNKTR